jgi:hypothetical protein
VHPFGLGSRSSRPRPITTRPEPLFECFHVDPNRSAGEVHSGRPSVRMFDHPVESPSAHADPFRCHVDRARSGRRHPSAGIRTSGGPMSLTSFSSLICISTLSVGRISTEPFRLPNRNARVNTGRQIRHRTQHRPAFTSCRTFSFRTPPPRRPVAHAAPPRRRGRRPGCRDLCSCRWRLAQSWRGRRGRAPRPDS